MPERAELAALGGLTAWMMPVSLITQTPRQLVMPLVQSLRHEMVARDGLALQKVSARVSTWLRAALFPVKLLRRMEVADDTARESNTEVFSKPDGGAST